jgi:iron complex outermembrane receptor protein
MRVFVRFLVLVLVPLTASADTLSGVVIAPDGHPVAEASVSIEGLWRSMLTDTNGRFRFEVPHGIYSLQVTRNGFETKAIAASAGEEVSITLRPALAESIVVSGIRAAEKTPITKTDVTRAEIEKQYYGQDIPFLLRDTPSINAYAEGGVGGAGYSYITLRGIGSTRLNFTLDGVPLADSEDMATYFVDFADLAHSLESIQVQRGVGTSTVGSPSFGGSVNLESIALSSTPATDVWLGGGSFGTKFGSIGYQSGALPGGISLYSRLSMQGTNGFREHSGVRQRNFFLSAAKQNENSQLKLTGFAAHERQQMSFLAADADTLKTNLKSNPLGPEDRDSFGYNLAQLQYLRAVSPSSTLSASVFFQRGYGWYRLDDRQYNLDGLLLGTMITYSTPHAAYGVHLNRFRREHSSDLIGGPRDYYNYGTKGEANAFARFTHDIGRWHLYSDNQLRSTNFHYHGDVKIEPLRWTFFNPKIGARYDLSASSGVYASAGISRREPARNDFFLGEDNATVPHDLRAVRPERLLDVEAGWDFRRSRASVAANLYAMEFRNEIAATGELSDIGLPLRRNVDRSFRRGIEIDAQWQVTPALRMHGNANLSRNRIHRWITYSNVNPLLTPNVLVNQAIDYFPTRRWSIGAVGRYVGKSYLDNTNDEALTTPSFFLVDAHASVNALPSSRLTLQVNNAFNRKRVFPSGYSYLGTRYFYPQATRNVVVSLRVNR